MPLDLMMSSIAAERLSSPAKRSLSVATGDLQRPSIELGLDLIEPLEPQYADANPDEELVRGFGWRYALFPPTGPTKELLDEIVAAAITETANQWQAIREAVATGDAGGVRAAAQGTTQQHALAHPVPAGGGEVGLQGGDHVGLDRLHGGLQAERRRPLSDRL